MSRRTAATDRISYNLEPYHPNSKIRRQIREWLLSLPDGDLAVLAEMNEDWYEGVDSEDLTEITQDWIEERGGDREWWWNI